MTYPASQLSRRNIVMCRGSGCRVSPGSMVSSCRPPLHFKRHMKNILPLLSLMTLSLIAGAVVGDYSPAATPPPTGDLAIVVHPDVPVQDLSLAEVRKIFMGDRQYWTPNLRITLLIRAPVSRERDVVLKTLYHMTEAEFRRYWISKVFRAEATSGPKV